MRKTIVTVGIIFILLLILVFPAINAYNGMVKGSNEVSEKWSIVQNEYKRRADLIPNLVKTVKAYAEFERGTLTQVIEARAKATSVNINPDKLDAESLKNFEAAQENLQSSLNKLMVVVERYPELQANKNFMALQAQLEGSENRIAVSRNDFITATKDYNNTIMKFPANLFAKLFGFKQKIFFETKPEYENPPDTFGS